MFDKSVAVVPGPVAPNMSSSRIALLSGDSTSPQRQSDLRVLDDVSSRLQLGSRARDGASSALMFARSAVGFPVQCGAQVNFLRSLKWSILSTACIESSLPSACSLKHGSAGCAD